jgi:nifR3 family TIM-barrel protein
MVRLLVDEGVDHLDLNLGCPVPKVTRSGGGSAIPAKPRLVARLVRAMVRNAGEVPVTVKMRKGLDEDLITYLDAARAAEGEGVAAVGLHARTAAQLYSGEADWSAITELKSAVGVPVLGNGDIWECWDALRMMRETGCDAVIVGRGCLGRPWIFRELAQVFDGDEPDGPPNLEQVGQVIMDHAKRVVALFGPDVGVRQMRKWMGWYTKGFRKSAALRRAAHHASTMAELEAVLAAMDGAEVFPLEALRVHRGKGSRTQRVKLPAGYRENLDDDTPPRGPRSTEEVEAWERALGGG